MRRAFPALLFALLAAVSARAGEMRAPEWRAPELRLGLIAHDTRGAETGSVSIAADLLFAIPGTEQVAFPGLLPRVQLGAIVNGAGRTSIAHAGLAWQVDLIGGLFAEAGLGVATHDGPTGLASRPGHAALGCRLLFRESLSLGYRVGGGWSVLASVEHFSNGGFCARNRGLTHAGLRMGYQF